MGRSKSTISEAVVVAVAVVSPVELVKVYFATVVRVDLGHCNTRAPTVRQRLLGRFVENRELHRIHEQFRTTARL